MKDRNLMLTMLGRGIVKERETSGKKTGVGNGGAVKRCSGSCHLKSPILCISFDAMLCQLLGRVILKPHQYLFEAVAQDTAII